MRIMLAAFLAVAMWCAGGADAGEERSTETRIADLERRLASIEGGGTLAERIEGMKRKLDELDGRVAALENAVKGFQAETTLPDELSTLQQSTTPVFSDNWELESLKNEVYSVRSAVESLTLRLNAAGIF